MIGELRLIGNISISRLGILLNFKITIFGFYIVGLMKRAYTSSNLDFMLARSRVSQIKAYGLLKTMKAKKI